MTYRVTNIRMRRALRALHSACDYFAECVPAAAQSVANAANAAGKGGIEIPAEVVKRATHAADAARTMSGPTARVVNPANVPGMLVLAASMARDAAFAAGDVAGAALYATQTQTRVMRLPAPVMIWDRRSPQTAEVASATRSAGDAAAAAHRAGTVVRVVRGAAWTTQADALLASLVVDVARVVRAAADAARRALLEAVRVFVLLGGEQGRPRLAKSSARPPGTLTRRALAAGCAVLPAGDRARYTEEWLSLLTELPTRRARAGHVLSILSCAPRQAWTLRRPLKHRPPA